MLDDLRHQSDAPLRWNVGQPHEPCMRHIMQVDQLPEVGVNRDEHAAQRLGQFKQRSVARVRAECACLQNIVSTTTKRLGQASPGATIYQKPHDPATETVAKVSRAITACA